MEGKIEKRLQKQENHTEKYQKEEKRSKTRKTAKDI